MSAPVSPTKTCQLCKGAEPIQGERFCKPCKRIAIDRMKADGYFVDARPRGARSEQKGRKALPIDAVGGSCEMLGDGDDPMEWM